jgi:hypothetical protein
VHWTCLLAMGLGATLSAQARAGTVDCVAPSRVRVWPVFLVPADQDAPTPELIEYFDKQLRWTRDRYREMLGGRDTFEIEDRPALVLAGKLTLAEYRALPEGGAPQYMSEVLAATGETRFSAPHVFLIMLMNPGEDFIGGGGRPLNGGLGTGGGVVILSVNNIQTAPSLQSTLQHELGHAFGLLHSDAYGFDIWTHDSIMSYNPAHHTNGLEPSKTPGILCPEDIRALALNKRVFANLTFDPATDIPEGYPMPPSVGYLPPMVIPGQLPYSITATTSSGEEYGSSVGNMLLGPLVPSSGPGNTFDPEIMWHSGEATDGWVQADVTFPCPVELSGVGVHTQHSGKFHAARAVQILVPSGDSWRQVVDSELPAVDEVVSFASTTAQVWRFRFEAGESNRVVVRALRFFSGETEIFPPLLPSRD